MDYFNDRKNVDDYIRMAKGYDGRELIETLKKSLPAGSTVLELGMGPGIDLEILSETYKVTGSDASAVFLDLYRENHPDADLLQLDAVTLKTDRLFDCIYSNKVLIHLSKADLKKSFSRQKALLAKGGLLMHSFWYGDKEEEHHGLHFTYLTDETLSIHIDQGFELVEMVRYREMKKGDSLYVILRKK